MEITFGFWVGFIAFVLIMLVLDLFVLHKKDEVMSVKKALGWSTFWISLALTFNVGVYFFLGHQKAIDFFTGYILEESLSVDNLFVFIMIFSFFKIKQEHQYKILFWGIIGAIVMRALFIFAGVALIQQFAWVMYIFGAFLIYTGIHMLFEKEDDKKDFDPNSNFLIKIFKKIIPVTDENPKNQFFIKKGKKTYATTFFITLLFIEASDVIFAVDSIPAILAVTTDTFIVFTSNIFAILGLRSLYFALVGVMDYFHYLKYALAAILSFIGVKMSLNELSNDLGWHLHIDNITSLGVIVILLTASILLSVYKTKKDKQKSV